MRSPYWVQAWSLEYVSVTVRRHSIGHRHIEYFLGQLLTLDWAAVDARLKSLEWWRLKIVGGKTTQKLRLLEAIKLNS